jgi:hypothetical protein
VLRESGSDAGEGHPFVWSLGSQTLLYTLDRATGSVDNLGLFVRSIAPTGSDPLAGAPAAATPGASSTPRTVGLLDPDGIIAVVPGTQTILYVAKDISVTPNVVSVRLADTSDGIHFTNDRAVSGLVTASLPFIGPRGTLLKYPDGHYGLIFSAGLVGEDADAFHFIGYAESNDLLTWTVVNGVDNPMLSTDSTRDPTGGQPWYAGRLYAPSLTLAADGCTGTLVFAGYKTVKPASAPDDYRQIGVTTLGSCSTTSGGTNGATSGGANGATSGGTNGSTSGGTNGATSGGTNGATSGGANGATSGGANGATSGGANGSTSSGAHAAGCDYTPGARAGALGMLLLLFALVRRRARRYFV